MISSNVCLKPARLAILIAVALNGFIPFASARDYFNPELLELDNPTGGKIDLTAYESGAQAPGTYHVDIVLDEQLVDTRDIEFTALHQRGVIEKLGCEDGTLPRSFTRFKMRQSGSHPTGFH